MSQETRTNQNTYLYKPEINVRIQDLYPILKRNDPILENNKPKLFKILGLKIVNNQEKPLDQIVTELKEIGDHKRQTCHTNSLEYGGLTFQLVILVAIITLIMGMKCVKMILNYPIPPSILYSYEIVMDTDNDLAETSFSQTIRANPNPKFTAPKRTQSLSTVNKTYNLPKQNPEYHA